MNNNIANCKINALLKLSPDIFRSLLQHSYGRRKEQHVKKAGVHPGRDDAKLNGRGSELSPRNFQENDPLIVLL